MTCREAVANKRPFAGHGQLVTYMAPDGSGASLLYYTRKREKMQEGENKRGERGCKAPRPPTGRGRIKQGLLSYFIKNRKKRLVCYIFRCMVSSPTRSAEPADSSLPPGGRWHFAAGKMTEGVPGRRDCRKKKNVPKNKFPYRYSLSRLICFTKQSKNRVYLSICHLYPVLPQSA